MQESETNGKFGFEKFDLLDTGRVQTVYTDNGAGNKILSLCLSCCSGLVQDRGAACDYKN